MKTQTIDQLNQAIRQAMDQVAASDEAIANGKREAEQANAELAELLAAAAAEGKAPDAKKQDALNARAEATESSIKRAKQLRPHQVKVVDQRKREALEVIATTKQQHSEERAQMFAEQLDALRETAGPILANLRSLQPGRSVESLIKFDLFNGWTLPASTMELSPEPRCNLISRADIQRFEAEDQEQRQADYEAEQEAGRAAQRDAKTVAQLNPGQTPQERCRKAWADHKTIVSAEIAERNRKTRGDHRITFHSPEIPTSDADASTMALILESWNAGARSQAALESAAQASGVDPSQIAHAVALFDLDVKENAA